MTADKGTPEMPEVSLTVTKCTIGGDWLVEDHDHIIAIFADWNPAIRFAHAHATLRANELAERINNIPARHFTAYPA